MTPALALDGLAKHYGRVEAVRDLTLAVQPGEVYGFLGVNGAGKTTTIRLILDLLRPSRGRARVFGHDCRTEGPQVRALTAYLPGELGFFSDMTGGQVLSLLGDLGPRQVNVTRRNALLERFNLSGRDLDRRIREYSTGMKRKLGLVQAFQHEAPLLVLDEPTEGLDPLMQASFFDLLSEETREGRTVFMSSHVLSEVEHACGRVGLLREGQLALQSSVADLRALAPRHVIVRFHRPVSAPVEWPDGCLPASIAAQAWQLDASGPLGPLVQRLSELPVADLVVESPRLEEVLSAYYRTAPRVAHRDGIASGAGEP